MHRPLHSRLRCRLACLTSALFIAASGAFAAASPDKTPKYYYDHAVELIAKGHLREAVEELQNALEGNPKDLASRVLLGRTWVDLENGDAAAAELARARKDGAPDSFVLVPLGRAYILQGEYRRVLKEIRPAGHDQGTAAAIIAVRGDAHLALGDRAKAEASYREAAAMRPGDAMPLVGMARARLAADDAEGARIWARRAVEANPNGPAAWLMHGHLAELDGALDDAIARYDRAVELAPEFWRAILARAAIRIERGEFDRAAADLDAAGKATSDDPHAVYLQSLMLSHENRMDEARALLIEADRKLGTHPPAYLQGHPRSLLLAGVADLLRRQTDAARQHLDLFLKQAPWHRGARKLLAAIALARNEPANALRLLEELDPRESGDIEVIVLHGDALVRLGRFRDACATLERAVGIAPLLRSELFRLLAIELGAGRDIATLRRLGDASARDPEAVRATTLLGSAQYRIGAYAAALESLGPVTEAAPGNALAHKLAGAAHLALGDLKSAWASYRKAIEAAPWDLQAVEQLGRIEGRLGNLDSAVALFSAALEKAPENATMLRSIALLYEQMGDSKALEFARRAFTAAPAEPAVLDTYGWVLVRNGKPEEGLMMLREASRLAPDELDIRYRAAVALKALGRGEEAVAELQAALAKSRPFDALADARALLAELAAQQERVR